jgi:hypothetical protein
MKTSELPVQGTQHWVMTAHFFAWWRLSSRHLPVCHVLR